MIHRADLFEESKQVKDNAARRKTLNSLLMGGKDGGINPDLTQFAVGVPDKPEFDNDRAKQFQNLSKAAAVAQGIDALVSAVGLSRTHGQQNEMRPTPSPVGELGLHSYNNLMGMEQAHRDQLNNWRDNVLDANKHNADLGIRTVENQMSLNKGVIENELKHLREMEKQGEITNRGLERQRGMLRRQLLQIGYDLDDKGNITELREGQADDSKFTPQQQAMFNSYLKYDQQASPDDYEVTSTGGRNPRVGSPSWHRDRLIDKLGDDFYLMMNQHQDTAAGPGAQSEGGVFTRQQPSGVLRNEYQPIRNDADLAFMQSQLGDSAQKIRTNQATPDDIQAWEEQFRRLAFNSGITDEQEVEENMRNALSQMMQSDTEQQPAQPDTTTPQEQQIAGMGQGEETHQAPEDQQSQQKSDADKLRQNTTAGTALRRINQAINNIHGIQNVAEQFPGFQQDLAGRRLREKQQEIRRLAEVISGYPKEQQDLVLRNISDRDLYDQIVNEMD